MQFSRTSSLRLLGNAAFAVFLLAGALKSSAGKQGSLVDVTLICAALSGLVGVWLAFQEGVSKQALIVLALFAVMAPALLYTEPTTYGVDKASRFFTLTLLAALAPCFLLRKVRDVHRLLALLALVGFLTAGQAIFRFGFGGDAGRLATESDNTAALSLCAGIGLLWLFSWSLKRTMLWRLLLWASCIPLLAVMIGTGSRAPLGFLIIVIVAITLRFSPNRRRQLLPVLAGFVAVTLSVAALLPMLPSQSLQRIEALSDYRADKSTEERMKAWHAAIRATQNEPLGLGFGGFSRKYAFPDTNRDFPHNIVLEVAVEQGWFAALAFVALLLFSIWRTYRAAEMNPELVGFFALLLYSALNTMVGGDLNDNKLLFAMLTIGLMSPSIARLAPSTSRSGPFHLASIDEAEVQSPATGSQSFV